MTNPAKCHCGSISWERRIEESRYICARCKRPLWQPIETAPQQGQNFLACGFDDEGIWFASVFMPGDDDLTGDWLFEGGATHWMPMPEGPGE